MTLRRIKNTIINIPLKKKSTSAFFIVGILLFVGTINSCDNSVEPFNRDEGFYSIYGAFNMYSDINYIRIKDLNVVLRNDTLQHLDANVTLENLTEETITTLKDTAVIFDDVTTHNFYTTSRPADGVTYQLTASGVDGTTSISTFTPYVSDIVVDTGRKDSDCNDPVKITFSPFAKQSTLLILFEFYTDVGVGKYSFAPDMELIDVNEQGVGKNVLSFTPADVIKDQNSLFFMLEDGESPCSLLSTNYFKFRFTHYGSNYTANLTDSINIPNGNGRFIAFYKDSLLFPIPAIDQYID